jgi:hypothetical protein
VNPVKVHCRLSDHKSEVELSIDLTKTVMRAGTEDKEVLGSLDFSITGVVSLWVKIIWVGEDLRVTEGGVGGRNDHGTCHRSVKRNEKIHVNLPFGTV